MLVGNVICCNVGDFVSFNFIFLLNLLTVIHRYAPLVGPQIFFRRPSTDIERAKKKQRL